MSKTDSKVQSQDYSLVKTNSTATPSGVSMSDAQVQSQVYTLVRVNSTATPSGVSKSDSQVQSQGLLSSESEQYSDSQ